LFYAVCVLVLVLDRVTKHWARVYLQGHAPIPVIPGFLQLTYTENYGAAFGLLQHQRWLFIAIHVAVAVGILVYLRSVPAADRVQRLGLGLLMAGALGNLVDRVAPGYVIDFVELPFWPVFNVADSAIVCGVIILAVVLYLEFREEARSGGESPADA